jgi:hypothetical protein
VTGDLSASVDIVMRAHDELAEALANVEEDTYQTGGLPHIRLSPERARYYSERIDALVEDILHEKPDPDGKVYGILAYIYTAPEYMQGPSTFVPSESAVADEEED